MILPNYKGQKSFEVPDLGNGKSFGRDTNDQFLSCNTIPHSKDLHIHTTNLLQQTGCTLNSISTISTTLHLPYPIS